MRGTSHHALQAARDQLTELVGGGDASQLAADLRSVAELLGSEAGLRRAFTDPARSAQARQGLAEQLLASRVSADALQVVSVVVRQRWNTSADLATAMELLAVQSELIDAERVGVMADVEDELFRFSRLVRAYPQLAAALADQSTPTLRRAGLVSSLLEGKANPTTIRLITFALSGLGGRTFDAALDHLVDLVAEQRDRQVAYVTTATPLTAAHEQRLAGRLSAAYGRQVSIRADVDPALLGGATIRIGNDLYDGSVARRLELAHNQLTSR